MKPPAGADGAPAPGSSTAIVGCGCIGLIRCMMTATAVSTPYQLCWTNTSVHEMLSNMTKSFTLTNTGEQTLYLGANPHSGMQLGAGQQMTFNGFTPDRLEICADARAKGITWVHNDGKFPVEVSSFSRQVTLEPKSSYSVEQGTSVSVKAVVPDWALKDYQARAVAAEARVKELEARVKELDKLPLTTLTNKGDVTLTVVREDAADLTVQPGDWTFFNYNKPLNVKAVAGDDAARADAAEKAMLDISLQLSALELVKDKELEQLREELARQRKQHTEDLGMCIRALVDKNTEISGLQQQVDEASSLLKAMPETCAAEVKKAMMREIQHRAVGVSYVK